MSDTKKPDATVDAKKPDENVDAAKKPDAVVDAGKKGGDEEEQANATINERARIEGITTCDEAKGRTALANHFAFKTAMSVDDAKVALAAAPKGDASATSALDAAMAKDGGPGVANNGGDDEEEQAKDDGGLLGAYASATGNKAVLRVVK